MRDTDLADSDVDFNKREGDSCFIKNNREKLSFFFSFLFCFAILYNRDAAKLLSLTDLVIFSFLAKV